MALNIKLDLRSYLSKAKGSETAERPNAKQYSGVKLDFRNYLTKIDCSDIIKTEMSTTASLPSPKRKHSDIVSDTESDTDESVSSRTRSKSPKITLRSPERPAIKLRFHSLFFCSTNSFGNSSSPFSSCNACIALDVPSKTPVHKIEERSPSPFTL